MKRIENRPGINISRILVLILAISMLVILIFYSQAVVGYIEKVGELAPEIAANPNLDVTVGAIIVLCCLAALILLYFRQEAALKQSDASMKQMEKLLGEMHGNKKLARDVMGMSKNEYAAAPDAFGQAYAQLVEYYENWRLVNNDTRTLYERISEGALYERINTGIYMNKYAHIPRTMNAVLDSINRMMDEIPIGIAIVDETYRVCYLNKMLRLTCGLNRKMIEEGATIFDITAIKNINLADSITNALEQEREIREEIKVSFKGKEYWIDVRTIPRMKSISGKRMVMQIITEQTELYELKRKADSANVAKSRFLSSMSHEIRTPINAILGYAQLLQESVTLSKSEKGFVDTIRKSGNHLLTIINDVLEISKIEEGRMEFHMDSFNLHSLVNECANMFRPTIQEKGLELTLTLKENVPYYVKSDQVKIRQMLLNVCSNAVKFTESGGIVIEVSADEHVGKDSASNICIDVSDTGFGIDQRDFERVFDVFKQTTSGKKSSGGTGLGMPISRTFARHLGGDIHILRSAIGKGTTFRIEFRVDVVEHADLPEEEVADNRHITGIKGSMRILVVDDNVENRSVVGLFLGKVGIDTVYAKDGKEAIRKARSYNPQMIFMDLAMPVIDGFEATKHIKSTEWGKDMHVIAVTANVLDETVQKVKEYGFADYIIKPFIKQQIFDVIQKFCDVEYIYETVEQQEDTSRVVVDREKLPEGFEDTIKKAVFYGDFDKVIKTVEELGEEFTDAKQRMLELAENFDGKSICNLIKGNAD